jgi:hypothetical protein
VIELQDLVVDFAEAMARVDAERPVATNLRSGVSFLPGIGPFSESVALRLVVEELRVSWPERYAHAELNVPYPELPRQRCDLGLRTAERGYDWAIEAKLFRLFGDNGRPNDNMLMHLLSPYPSHRSAVTDCEKLRCSQLGSRAAVLVYGFDNSALPLETAVRSFEALARLDVHLGNREQAWTPKLVHPIHSIASVCAWEILR